MYSVSSELYHEVATRLADAIGPRDYFSGSVAFAFGGVECRLSVTAIVYRRQVSLPEGPADEIADLVPVWWEFHTSDDASEQLNDFSFGALRWFL